MNTFNSQMPNKNTLNPINSILNSSGNPHTDPAIMNQYYIASMVNTSPVSSQNISLNMSNRNNEFYQQQFNSLQQLNSQPQYNPDNRKQYNDLANERNSSSTKKLKDFQISYENDIGRIVEGGLASIDPNNFPQPHPYAPIEVKLHQKSRSPTSENNQHTIDSMYIMQIKPVENIKEEKLHENGNSKKDSVVKEENLKSEAKIDIESENDEQEREFKRKRLSEKDQSEENKELIDKVEPNFKDNQD